VVVRSVIVRVVLVIVFGGRHRRAFY
jgi:hypothetical protein